MKFKKKWIMLLINFLISCATPRNTQDIALVTDWADTYSSKVAERYYQTYRRSDAEGDRSRYKLEYYFDGVKQEDNCFMLEEKGFDCYIDFCNALIGAGSKFGGCNNKLRHEVLFQSFLVEINTGEVYRLVNYQTSFLEHDDTVVWTRIYVGTKEFEKKSDFLRYEDACSKQERSFNATYSENLQDSIYFQTCILVKENENSDRKCKECF